MLEIVEMAREIVAEMGTEVAHAPLRLVAEVLQFLVLVGIVWVVAFGFGKRKGFVSNMLTERERRIATHLTTATAADEALATATAEAEAAIRTAEARAHELTQDAATECAEVDAATRAEVDAECTRITERAESALATERQEMQLELREQLVELVSSATRSIMNERLTAAEQRELIEHSITSSMDGAAAPVALRLKVAQP
ncbi:MAG: ATP synthase F0 subunit B [Coriobacteriia bacterium]|nr:ATP synthase F0 subunit B [Coriobacteriia bacterium]